MATLVLWNTHAQGVTAFWNVDAAGNWTTPANWLGGVIPDAVGDVANFNFNLTANRTVTLNAPITLGGLVVGDTLGTSIFTFAGSSALTFDAAAGNAFIEKYNTATDVWQAPLILNDSLNANIFAGTLDVTGASNAVVQVTGSGDIIKNGTGTMRLNLDAASFNGDWVLNYGTLNVGGANVASAFNLGNGTGGIILNGAGIASHAIFSLNNNGGGSNGLITYMGNNNVTLQGGATINVDRNYISAANSGNTIVLNDLLMNGGILGVTGANGYQLRFNGTTTLAGQTNVFSPTSATLTLGGDIVDGANSRALIKEGSGRLVIASATNAYDGVTAVKDGFLQIASGAVLGGGKTFVNGGVLSLVNSTQTSVATIPGGLELVSQIGTSRAIMPVIGNTGFVIDSINPLAVTVPVYGMVLGIDGSFTSNIDISQIGGGDSTRVSVANVGGDRTYGGVLSPASDGVIRLNSPGSTFIINGVNSLGGGNAADLMVGLPYANPLNFIGLAITQGSGGAVSIRNNNAAMNGTVTVNRGVTLNINGATVTSPLGTGAVTALGGIINTDNATAAQFANTDFRLYGGSTLLLDNRGVTAASTNRRLLPTTDIRSVSSTLQFAADGGAAGSGVQAQTIDTYTYQGGNFISIGRDGATAGTRAELTIAGGLVRDGRGTIILNQIDAQAATLGTASATSRIFVTPNPTVTNGMIGADIALLGTPNMQDRSLPMFVTYNATNGIEAAAFTHTSFASTTTASIVSLDGAAVPAGTQSVQALRMRSTSSSHALTGGTITIGAAAAPGQGAGLYFAHTSNDTVTHTSNFAFGSQEGLLYVATTGGSSGVVSLGGVLSGTNGITRFGDGILRITGTNTFTGGLNINSGETRLNAAAAAGALTGPSNNINLWGGALYLEAGSQRYNNNIVFHNDARFGNVNVASSGFNGLVVEPRVGSSAPIVLDIRDQAGSNATVAYGGLTLNGPAQAYISHAFQINGAITGPGVFEKFGNERLFLGGDSSAYTAGMTVHTGFVYSLNANSMARPFGGGTIKINPGGTIRLAAPSNIDNGQVVMNSDSGGIAAVGMSYVGDPAALPVSPNSTATWKGTLGLSSVAFSTDIDQSTLWGGGSYLGSLLGDTGIYTGTLTPDVGGIFRLGTGQGALRVAKPLTGLGNSVQVGLSMTGDVGRANQNVNNSGGAVQFDVPMTYGGDTVVHSNITLRLSAANATLGLGAITLNGGALQADSVVGQLRMIAPMSIANTINLSADSTIQMQNNASDFRITGVVNLANDSTGVVRQLNVGVDQPGAAANNAGTLYLDGGIADGVGSSGNHFIKAGAGTIMLTGIQTFTGTTNVTGGLLGINGDADLASSSQIILAGGGLAIFENSFTTSRDISFNGGNGWLDVMAGLTLTQDSSSTFDGANFIMKRGLGTVILNGNNAQVGLFLADGILQVNNQAAFGDPARSGGSDIQFGGDQTIGGANNGTRYTGGTLRINGTMATNRGITFNNNANTTYSGSIDVTAGSTFTVNGVITQGTENDFAFKTGAGTLITAGANGGRQYAITNGTFQFGTSTPWSNGTATSTEVTNIEMLGGTIRAVNTGTNIALTNLASTTNYNYGGGAHVRMESGAGVSIEFAADNLTRVNQGTLVLETAGGTVLGGAGATNAGRLLTTNFNGVARASMLGNGIFSPHLLAADANGTASFTTNDAATGIVPYAGAMVSTINGLTPTAIASISSPQTLTGVNSVYALRTTADISGGSLLIPSVGVRVGGGILFNGSNTISSSVTFDPASATATSLTGGSTAANSTTVTVASTAGLVIGMGVTGLNIPAGAYITAITSATQFTISVAATAAGTAQTFTAYEGSLNSGEALLYVKNNENATISGSTMAGSLTKFGSGTLTMSGGTTVSGDVNVQNGTLKLGGAGITSRMNSEININAGATLDLNGTSVAVETIGSNNRQVGGVNVGGSITNSDTGTTATLAMESPISSTFTGTLNGNLKLLKAGAGVLTIDGYRASTPDSGNNTYTGGTDIYGIGVTGGITLDNAVFGLGGANGSTPGDVNLYSGTLGLLYSNTTTAINSTHGQHFSNQVVKFGAESTLGLTVNVRGPALINVNQGSVSLTGQGNIMQIGALNMSNATLTLGGGNLYRLRVAGTTTIQGGQAAFQNNNDGPSGVIELAGQITGSGTLTKLGDGNMRAIIISNPTNNYAGGTNIVGGDVQVTATTGTPLGSGPVRVFSAGSLHLAGNGSVDGSKLQVLSGINAFGAVVLDNNFNPTVLTAANFSSVYNNVLQIGQPYWSQPLDMAAIGDGRAFLSSGIISDPIRYMAPTLGAGAPDAWNPGVGVYRISGGVTNFSFEGVNNVLTGNSYLQVGPQRNMVLGAIANSGNAVIIRNSNNYTGGTQIAEGTVLLSEVGGSPIGETPLGTGTVEVYGEYRIQGNLGSAWKADAAAATNTIILRPSGVIRILDATNLIAGDQGRWGDAVPLDLNGGQFRYDGAANYQSVETIGDVTVRKGGIITVARNSTASSAQLNIASLTRADRGTLTLNYNNGFLGINVTTPDSYERLVVSGGVPGGVGGSTANGADVSNPGMVAPWMVDRVTSSFLGYDATGANTGFQPLLGAAPGAGQIAYSDIVTGALTAGLLSGTDIADLTTAAKTLADNPSLYAMRTNQNLSPTASNKTVTLTSGGLIMTGGIINPTSALPAGAVSEMTLNFGVAGAGEAFIYVGAATSTIQAQIVAAQGLTKFGPNQLSIHSINPGIGDAVVVNEGTLFARVPVAGGGSGGAVGTVFNGQDIILNGGGLALATVLANAAGTASEIASNVVVSGTLGSSVFVRGDASLSSNGQVPYVKINNLTIANDGNAPAMDGNGVISLALQSGIWVGGTTTLSPQARLNVSQSGMHQSTLAGPVVGVGGVLEKFGNGGITLLNAGNTYSGGTIVHGTTAATAVSTVASGVRGAGTPFGTGSITVNPGGMLRVADNANIASNAVTLKSDGLGLAGIGIAHNGPLPTIITTGTPAAGQVKVESTGPFAGVIGLDYGYYSQGLDMAAIPGGAWWLGNSIQGEAYYFNPSLGAASGGKYLLGGGGSNSGVNFGSVLVNAGRTTVFEDIFSGGTPNQVKIEVGAQTGDFAWNAPSFVNGNSGFIVMATRNTGLVGDVRVNTNSTLSIGNSFALGSGRLVLNGGNIRSDFGNNNFASGAVTLNNNVVLQGDYNALSGGDLILRGNVAMSDVLTAGATRNFNINLGNLAVRGVISGAAGSNLIKLGGTSLILTGANTYQGYTQVTAGTLYFAGDVMPNQPGPLGMSDSPVIMAGGTLRAAGRLELARDIIVNGTGTLDTSVHDQVVVSGGVSIASTFTLTVGSAGIDHPTFRGGLLRFTGPISGAGALTIGTTAAVPNVGGTVHFAGTTNGYGINTYSGGTTIQTARVQLSGATYYTGPASNPLIISGPLGTGAITIGGGESNRGAVFEAVGGPVTIVNPFAAISTAANTVLSFGGHEALSFTRDLNLNSDNTLRSRTFAVQNVYQPVTFSGNLSATGTAGVSLIKTGPGKLILTGTNTFATSSTTGIQISSGILQVGADASLGGGTSVRLSGGYLAASETFSTARQLILTVASGVDVAAGRTLTLTAATAGAFGLTKAGPGTLALNNSANTQNSLTIGGVAQLYSGVGFSGITGGVVSTTATSGTPFAATASGTVTIHGGALALIGGATAQALTIPTLNYGANAAIALFQGSTSSQLTIGTAFNRAGAFNSVNYGTLTVVPSVLANLGGTEKILVTTGAPANTATGGGGILTTPSIFARLQAANSDANFTRYDTTNGIMVHNVATVASLGATASANVADISAADVAGAGNIDVQAVRTTADIAPTDGTTLVRIARGGLIINGGSGATISAPLLFGTGTGSSLTEAIVYAREGQSGVSALTGGITARDFTKTGPGLLEIGGSSNLLNSNAVRLPVLSVQDGTMRFATTNAFFQNQLRGTTLGDFLGHFVLNVNEAGVFDLNGLNVPVGALTGNGTVRSGLAGPATLTVENGFGVDTTFNGQISDGAGTVSLVKTQNGILTLSGHSSHTGGTDVQAGRVTNATGSTTVLGRLEAQTVTALGNGPITLSGGWLRLNGVNLLGSSPAFSEVSSAIDYLLWGTNGGYNITVASTAFTNGIALPANISSILTAATLNAGINNLTIDAPMLTTTEGLIQVLGTTTFSQSNTVLRLAGGRLFLAGKIDAAGKTITKTGANDLVLTNSASGAGQNQVGLWKVYGGILEARTTNGSSNPLGVNPMVELNTGSSANGLRLLTDGDGTGLGERITTYADTNVRFGSMLGLSSDEFVSSSTSRLSTDRAFVANNSWKTVQINNLEVGGALGSPLVYTVLGNNDSLWVNGTTTFTRELNMQIDGGQGLVLNGLISGNGTVNRRSNGGTLYINADNTNGYSGGTFIVGGGRNYFGSIEGGQVTLNNNAKLGQGHVFLGPIALFQINDAGNLQADQNIYVGGNLSWFANLSLAADLSLEQVRLRALGLGGVQNTHTDYFLSATNPSSGVLSLGTVYTHELDMRTLGDGMWYLGSSTNGIGANGVYNASTLKPGLGNTYRLGAGSAGGIGTLFIGTNGNANVLTDVDASTPSSLVVGSPMTVQSMGPGTWGAGGLVLMNSQNYTGATLVNTGSWLDFRGTMTTSDFKVYGTLNVAGEAGTFINPVTGTNIPVTLRPGSLLRFDNTSAGAPATSATEGRWKDTSPLSLANSVLRLQGNAAVEVTETVGAITSDAGGNRIEIVRGGAGRSTELRTPSITRANSGTVQLIHNGGTLGSDERVVLTGAAPTITNGMVAPWIFSASDVQFVTHNSSNGFVLSGFDHVFNAAATVAASVNAAGSRAFFSAVPTLNNADYSVYGLRIDADVNLTTASAATSAGNRLILGSGGLLVNGARTIQAGIWAGAAGDQELIIYNNNTLNVGILANNTTSGRIRASSITKTGAGTFQILSEQNDFSGDIRIQQGALQLAYTGTSTANLVSSLAGNGSTLGTGGGNIVFQGNNTSLILRIGNDSFTGFTFGLNNNIVLGDYLSVATLNMDRNGGGISAKTMVFNNLTFGQSEGDVGQVLRILGANGFRTQFNGTTTLNGRSSFAVENNYNNTAADLLLMGKVTGNGTLIKGPSDSRTRNLLMQNVNTLNDYTGGTILLGGTLQVQARATNVVANTSTNITTGGLGSNPSVILMEGTLDLRVDGNDMGAAVPDTEIEFIRYTSGSGAGLDITVNGSAIITADRNAYTGTYTKTAGNVTATLPGGHGFVVGQSITIGTGGGPNTGTFVITAVTADTVTYVDSGTGTATSGYFTMTSNVSANKVITFNNLTIGSQTLTTGGGNGYGQAFAGTTSLLGSPIFNIGSEFVLGGGSGAAGTANSIITDGGQIIFSKIGTGTLWVHSANTDFNSAVYINSGALDFGNRSVANNSASFGTGPLYINPGASIRLRNTANINTALGQKVSLIGTSYSPSFMRIMQASPSRASIEALLQSRTSTSNEVVILGFDSNISAEDWDQSTLGDGRVYFGAVAGDRSYTGSGTTGVLIPGLASLPNNVVGGGSTNRAYRFGGGDTTTRAVIVNLNGTNGNLNDFDDNPTDLLVGSLAAFGPSGNIGAGQLYLQDQNTYTGETTVSRGSVLRTPIASTSTTAGPFGVPGDTAIHVYGTLQAESSGSFRSSTGLGNAYTNINLHPGSSLVFLDNSAANPGNGNRWDDSTPISLDGARLVLDAVNNGDLSAETVGDITFDRGARITTVNQGTSEILLTANSITRAAASAGAGTGRGTMVFLPSVSGNLGLPSTTNNAEQVKFTTVPTVSSISAVANMLPGYYVEGTGGRFVTYGPNGVTPVADGAMSAFVANMTAGTAVVNMTGNLSLPDFNPVIFALRVAGNITLNSPTGANNDATITFGGSGGDIGGIINTTATGTINPNLKFGLNGTNEALFYLGSTMTLNGNITAGSITKFGAGQLNISNDQSDAARGIGQGYSGGWFINEGSVNMVTFGSAGNAVASNVIVLNGNQIGTPTLFLRANPADSLINYSYSSGRIYAVDNAVIDWDAGADDRVHSIADIEIQQSGGIGQGPANANNDALLRIILARNRSILAAGSLTLASNSILAVDPNVGPSNFQAYGNNGAYLTNGISTGMSVSQIIGGSRLTKWGDGYLYVRGASPGFTGTVVIDQGAIHVTHNNSLGSGDVIVNRYGTLDIGVANFVPTNSSITYNEGSIERWSVNGARAGSLNLGKATLQVAANQPTTNVAVTLNGGGVEAWLRSDDLISAQSTGGVLRVLNPNITFTLAGDSFVGARYYLGANGLDLGKQTHDNRPLTEYLASGAILEIKGVISGPGKLTKAGYDVVILSGSNVYEGGTDVEGGRLLLGRDDALPTNTRLTTMANAVLDLNGQNQTVGVLTNPGTPAAGVNSTSGYITNSSTVNKTLTVGNTVTTDFAYSGVIQHNVSLTKAGTAVFTLNNVNTYLGKTTVAGGSLQLGTNGTIDDTSWIEVTSGARLDLLSKLSGYTYDGIVSGGGVDPAGTTFVSVVNAGRIDGALVIGDHTGLVSGIGTLRPGGSSSATAISTAGNQIGHLYTSGDLTLTGGLTSASPVAPVTRLTLQLNGATATAIGLGLTSGESILDFVAGLPGGTQQQQDTLNGLAGNLGNHDYVNVGGLLMLNANGRVAVTNYAGYNPAYGDVFNLLDWAILVENDFTVASDLSLPALPAGQFWDTSLFISHGVVVVVPEPSRALFLLLGLCALFIRRRRR
ncbi:MAG: autotransporter-associated beta strand repeat-containing protein [Prosthecobacter sp.]